MSLVPVPLKIYHITHMDNLPMVIQQGGVWSDAQRMANNLVVQNVGMTEIKRRRLEDLKVSCYSDTKVGEYVPFNFCPRSIMLFLLSRSNHPDLTYRGGQYPIVHLQADLLRVVQWADAENVRWAFTKQNAGTRYARFFNHLDDLNQVNWEAVHSTDFRGANMKEDKQAEFLLHEFIPWSLVEKIGVCTAEMAARTTAMIQTALHKPLVSMERDWYY